MKYVIVLALCFICSGCAVGAATSATAGYSLRAKTADELAPEARASIIKEMKDYMKEAK